MQCDITQVTCSRPVTLDAFPCPGPVLICLEDLPGLSSDEGPPPKKKSSSKNKKFQHNLRTHYLKIQ